MPRVHADTLNLRLPTKPRAYFWRFYSFLLISLLPLRSQICLLLCCRGISGKVAGKLCQEPSLKPSAELSNVLLERCVVNSRYLNTALSRNYPLSVTKDGERIEKRSSRPANFTNFTTVQFVGKSRKQALLVVDNSSALDLRSGSSESWLALRSENRRWLDDTHTHTGDGLVLSAIGGRFRPSARVKFSQYERNDLREEKKKKSYFNLRRLTCRSPYLGDRATRGRRSQF